MKKKNKTLKDSAQDTEVTAAITAEDDAAEIAAETAAEETEAVKEKLPLNVRARNFTYEAGAVVITSIVIIAIIFTCFCRFSAVSGESMLPTLDDGDWVLLSELRDTDPENGDIVVISQPNVFDEVIIKRVIATEGQTIDIDFEKGTVKVDGKVLEEDYINNPTTTDFDVEFPLTVPDGYCFVMGDNRQHSVDSRSSGIGLIRNDYIIGIAVLANTDDGFVTL